MAEYKKKKVKVKQHKKPVSHKQTEIKMQPRTKKVVTKTNQEKVKTKTPLFFKVRSFIVSASLAVAILACYLIIHLLHPVGVLEYLGGTITTIGTGKYPVSLHGGDAIQVEREANTYIVLSETNIDIFNKSGREVLSEQHGFLQPVLRTSDVRYLVYDQGGKNLKLFNNSKLLISKKYDNEIITAEIAKNGTYAVVTRADGYQSQIIVTDKNEKKIFEWYCADETINNVALTNDGNTLIVSAFKVVNGSYKTKVYVLNYNSGSPKYSYDYDDIVFSVDSSGNNKAVLVFSDKLEFLNLKNGQITTNSLNYKINTFKRFDNSFLTSSSLAANKNETLISLCRFDGKEIDSFKFFSSVDDVTYLKGKYYILSESVIYQLSNTGEILMSTECSFDTKHLIPVPSDSVIGISYSKVNKYSLNSKEGK